MCRTVRVRCCRRSDVLIGLGWVTSNAGNFDECQSVIVVAARTLARRSWCASGEWIGRRWPRLSAIVCRKAERLLRRIVVGFGASTALDQQCDSDRSGGHGEAADREDGEREIRVR